MMTNEERSVLAWERIADELTLLNQSLEHIFDTRRAIAPEGSTAGHGRDATDLAGAGPGEENAAASDPGMNPSTAKCFSVGGYRYTNLQHAMEQARRDRSAKDRAPENPE
jgi:hypothetical protein